MRNSPNNQPLDCRECVSAKFGIASRALGEKQPPGISETRTY